MTEQYELEIIIEEKYEIAKDILKNYQYFVYLRSAKALLRILMGPIKKFIVSSENGGHTFVEKGDKDYIELQKRKFENFMFSEYDQLRKNHKKYETAMGDRWIQKVMRNVHKKKDKIKSKAIRAALGGTDVLSFFTKVGIFIKWDMKEEKYSLF